MYGAIIGDLIGSIYEYSQLKEIKSIKIDKLDFNEKFYSDDTILTIAILDAILNNKDYDYYLRKYVNEYKDYKPNVKPYFDKIFSSNIIKWAETNNVGYSHGNGAMMRISPVGYMFDNIDDVILNSKEATIPSHNSKEAIESACLISSIIFYLRKGYSKEEVFKKLNINVNYKPFLKFNTTCEETIDNCLYAFYNSNSFEDSMKKTLLMGGDTDTNCAIVGSLAEALYGIDNTLIEQVNKIIPSSFVKILKKAYKK